MRELSDKVIAHLQKICDAPDLTGTKYRLVQEIGRGGMGIVYEAEDIDLQRRVALKVLNEGSPLTSKEAQILAQLEHPGIVPVHDTGILPDGRSFYAMKLVRGTRLDAYRADTASLSALLRMFQKICDAVAFAHAHAVVHRDLKPENIMVGCFGEVLIMDWGVARVLNRESCEPNGLIVGTDKYMAPEQARGESENIDPRADVYSLGAILNFLIGPSALRPLQAICAKAMSAEVGDRYTTAAELGDEVARFLDGMPVQAYPEGIFERAARLISRNKMACVLVLTYLALRILFIFLFRR
jgi:serine/threonine protein kinase